MSSRFGFETEEDRINKRQEEEAARKTAREEYLQALNPIIPIIDPIVRAVLIDFAEAYRCRSEVLTTDEVWELQDTWHATRLFVVLEPDRYNQSNGKKFYLRAGTTNTSESRMFKPVESFGHYLTGREKIESVVKQLEKVLNEQIRDLIP